MAYINNKRVRDLQSGISNVKNLYASLYNVVKDLDLQTLQEIQQFLEDFDMERLEEIEQAIEQLEEYISDISTSLVGTGMNVRRGNDLVRLNVYDHNQSEYGVYLPVAESAHGGSQAMPGLMSSVDKARVDNLEWR